MAEKPRYWSPAFIDLYVETLNEDDDFFQETKRFDNTIILRCLDTPDGRDVEAAYTIDHGEVTVSLTDEAAPSELVREAPFDRHKAMARATAPYEVWTRLDKGEMNVLSALASPDYQIEGPTIKIMLNIGVFNALSAVAAAIEKTY